MNKTIVLTGTGKDRVGIVADLSDFLFKLGCNLLDSSMTLLRGEFALILMLTLPEALSIDELRARLAELESKLSLTFSLRELDDEELKETDDELFQFIVSVYGADKPGIVAGISKKLAELKLNITDVQTKAVKQNGSTVYVMVLELTSKEAVDLNSLKDTLAGFCKGLNVDVNVQELEILEL